MAVPASLPKLFLSHFQAEARSEAMAIFHACENDKLAKCWLDIYRQDKNEQEMEAGIKDCDVFVAILSESYFDRPYCLKELLWAQKYRKRILPVAKSVDKPKFSSWASKAPQPFRWIFKDFDIKSLEMSDMKMFASMLKVAVECGVTNKKAPEATQAAQVAVDALIAKTAGGGNVDINKRTPGMKFGGETFGSTGGYCHDGSENVYSFHGDGLYVLDLNKLTHRTLTKNNYSGWNRCVYWNGAVYVWGKGGTPGERIQLSDRKTTPLKFGGETFGSSGGYCHDGKGKVYSFHADGFYIIDLTNCTYKTIDKNNYDGWNRCVYWNGEVYVWGKYGVPGQKIRLSDMKREPLTFGGETFGSSGGYCHDGNGKVYSLHGDGLYVIDLADCTHETVDKNKYDGWNRCVLWNGALYAWGKNGVPGIKFG